MSAALIQFGTAAAIIIVAGTFLVRFADRIAEETGWGRVLIDEPDLAVGDLLGSSLFILAMVDSVYRHPRRAFTSEFVHHAQTAVLSIHLTALVGFGILPSSELIVLMTLGAFYILYLARGG